MCVWATLACMVGVAVVHFSTTSLLTAASPPCRLMGCLRLQLAGYGLLRSSVKVTHAAHRSSRVNLRHLAWHVASLLRLWTSTPYRDFVRIKQKR